jgi:hypothetical protein
MEGGGRSNSTASWWAEGIQPSRSSGDEIAGASSARAIVGAGVAGTGRLRRTETWHCPQHSREESAGPDGRWWDLRQQLALLLSLQQQEAEPCEANASAEMGWARRKAASALARI